MKIGHLESVVNGTEHKKSSEFKECGIKLWLNPWPLWSASQGMIPVRWPPL